ncbi:hypothetical protein [Streptomyces sp. NBC_01530]
MQREVGTEHRPDRTQAWVFSHMRRHPERTSYAEVIERPWVMWQEGPA